MQKDDKNICGAKTRAGHPCKNAPVKGRERCRLHGGTQKRGVSHHNYRYGKFSAYASESLKEILDQLDELPSEELISVDSEIKLMQALIISSKALERNLSDLNDLKTISEVIEKIVRCKQRSHKLQIEQSKLVPANDLRHFLTWLENVLIKEVGKDKSDAVMNKLTTFKISDNEIREITQ